MKTKGFTLIELLVVIAIIGILFSVVRTAMLTQEEIPVEIPSQIIEKEISILKEQKECKEWGGEFYFDDGKNYGWRNPEEAKMEFSCTKTYTEGNKEITETLFDYKFEI